MAKLIHLILPEVGCSEIIADALLYQLVHDAQRIEIDGDSLKKNRKIGN